MKTFVTVLLLFKHLNIILFRITKTYHHNEVYTVSNITFQSLILIKFKLLKELYPRAVAGERLRSSSDRRVWPFPRFPDATHMPQPTAHYAPHCGARVSRTGVLRAVVPSHAAHRVLARHDFLALCLDS